MTEKLFSEYFPLAIIVLWPAATGFISAIGGWGTLAEFYRKPPDKKCGNKPILLSGVGMRFMLGYHNCVFAAADNDGLYLSVIFLFRLFHPPLFIPWPDIKAERRKYLFVFNMIRLDTDKSPGIPIDILERHAKQLGIIERLKIQP